MMYHNPRAVVQVNGRRLRAFAIERLVRQGCPLSPLLYVLALEACSVGLGMRGRIRPCAVSPLLALLGQGFLRSLMISQCLYPAAWR